MNYKFYLLLILACNLFGMPANPNPVLFTQPDNTSFYGYIKGDEWQHWKETIKGAAPSRPNNRIGMLNTSGVIGPALASGTNLGGEKFLLS